MIAQDVGECDTIMAICVIRREECTSCASCWDLCPEFFEMNPDDSLSEVVPQYRRNDNLSEGDVPEELKECVQDAADSCPVQIISVEE
jgi:ferredoxin